MACMEHLCSGCGELVFNNDKKPKHPCPKCGGTAWASQWDEQYDRVEEEETDED